MLNYTFDDYLDLSPNEHYELAQILDAMTCEDEQGDYEGYLSFSVEG